jgi:hypothetical protein
MFGELIVKLRHLIRNAQARGSIPSAPPFSFNYFTAAGPGRPYFIWTNLWTLFSGTHFNRLKGHTIRFFN